MDSPTEDEQSLGFFKVWFMIAQLLGVVCISLIATWTSQYLGGFSWQDNPQLQFNYHPLFMIIGFVFCYGDAILIYRVMRNERKQSLKLIHMGLHGLAFIFTVVALKAAFDSHNLAKPSAIPNLYSLHSWIGLTAVILFTAQYVCGFIAFFYPGMTKVCRSKYLPCHVYFGLAIFLMGIASALMGITEKLIWSLDSHYQERPASAVVANILGLCLVILAALVVYMVTTPQFRRRPLPEEVALQLEPQSPVN